MPRETDVEMLIARKPLNLWKAVAVGMLLCFVMTLPQRHDRQLERPDTVPTLRAPPDPRFDLDDYVPAALLKLSPLPDRRSVASGWKRVFGRSTWTPFVIAAACATYTILDNGQFVRQNLEAIAGLAVASALLDGSSRWRRRADHAIRPHEFRGSSRQQAQLTIGKQ